MLNAVERIASGYESEAKRVREDLTVAEGQVRDFGARLGQPFQQTAYLGELTKLRDELKAGLAGAPQEEGKEKPSVAELAERIKLLRAANTVEAAPQRTAKRQVSAEEPVTTRIRRRETEEPGTVVDDADVASASRNRLSEEEDLKAARA